MSDVVEQLGQLTMQDVLHAQQVVIVFAGYLLEVVVIGLLVILILGLIRDGRRGL